MNRGSQTEQARNKAPYLAVRKLQEKINPSPTRNLKVSAHLGRKDGVQQRVVVNTCLNKRLIKTERINNLY